MICASAALSDGGDGVRFTVRRGGRDVPAFVVRFGGQVFAYLNRCTHVAVELDWQPGRFFDADRAYLICATHGALYRPESGRCVAGPCRGGRLEALVVVERDGGVFLAEDGAG